METYGWHAQLDALGDPTRRAIVELLAAGPSPVGELAARLPVSRPAVSQHLRVLQASGLVSHRATGTRRVYRLAPGGPTELRACLDRFWGGALASYAEVVAIDAAHRALAEPEPSKDDPVHDTREDQT